MGIQETAKMLLPDADEGLLGFTVSLVEDSIKNYCNLPEVPPELQNTAAAMVVDAWRQHQFGQAALEAQEKGVSRGDTSFSFATPAEQMQAIVANPGFTQDYRAQLNQFRKLRW